MLFLFYPTRAFCVYVCVCVGGGGGGGGGGVGGGGWILNKKCINS